MKGTSVGTCLATAVSEIRFPKSQQGVSKTWTLSLSPPTPEPEPSPPGELPTD
jgi:hypothetical protein